MRRRVSHHTVGYGHLYQGRFKSFPIQQDQHLLSVCRYVERNAVTAKLVNRPLTTKALERMQSSLSRGRPFGDDTWQVRTVGHGIRRN